MSTRGISGWKVDGKYTMMYNHSDSYLSQLGNDMIRLALKIEQEKGWDILRDNARKVKHIDDQGKAPKKFVEKYQKYSQDLGGHDNKEWYTLLRNIQGTGYIEEVYSGELQHVPHSPNFIKDSLFCEFAYTFNLDENCIEFYQGFQRQKTPGNPFGVRKSNGYYPCKLVGVIPFSDIPSLAFSLLVDKEGGGEQRLYKMAEKFYPKEDRE